MFIQDISLKYRLHQNQNSDQTSEPLNKLLQFNHIIDPCMIYFSINSLARQYKETYGWIYNCAPCFAFNIVSIYEAAYLRLTDQLWLQVAYKAYNMFFNSMQMNRPMPCIYTTSASLYILNMIYSVPVEVINP